MAKKFNLRISEDALRVLLIVLGSFFSTVVLVFSVLAIQRVQISDFSGASIYLMIIFMTLALSRLVTFIKDRSRSSLFRVLTLFILDVTLGIIVLFGKYNLYYYDLCGGLFCVTVVISRIMMIVHDHSKRSVVFNLIIIALAVSLGVGLFFPTDISRQENGVLVLCIVIIFASVIEVIASASSNLKMKVLVRIIIRTYALEIILGLVTMVVAFSLVLSLYEPNIKDFYDGLWYSFSVVTTIGFGDLTPVTPIGKGLTVVLGIYGIVVVAVLTSIIVNFYNETMGKKNSEEIKQLHEEAKKKEENKHKK